MLNTVKTDIIECIIGRNEMINHFELFDKNAVHINIYDPIKTPIRIDHFHDTLNISFWDIDQQIGNYKPIDDETAEKIVDFIVKHNDKKFAINCEAGQSRSAAVALAVECILKFKGDKKEFSKEVSEIYLNRRYTPLLFVFDKLCEVYEKKYKNSIQNRT